MHYVVHNNSEFADAWNKIRVGDMITLVVLDKLLKYKFTFTEHIKEPDNDNNNPQP